MMIRRLAASDAPKLLEFYRRLVETDPERVERLDDVRRLDLADEVVWIKQRIELEDKGEAISRCVFSDAGELVAQGEVERQKRWIERHVGEIRFGVLPGNEAAASKLVEELIQKSSQIGLEILYYFHLESQRVGIRVMREIGFYEVGEIKKYYKRGHDYTDRIYMAKDI